MTRIEHASEIASAVGRLPQRVALDLDGDGQTETLQLNLDGSTDVLRGAATLWSTAGWIGGWNRSFTDVVVTAGVDVNVDGRQEVMIFNSTSGWVGLLAWQADALSCMWATGAPQITGPVGAWNRRSADAFGVTEWQGRPAISVTHAADQWYGTLAWVADRLALVALWQGGVTLRKFTFLLDVVEVTGTVECYWDATADGAPIAPGMALALEAGYHSLMDSVLGAPQDDSALRLLHCETYGQGISVPEWNGDTQINAMKPFEPWPGQVFDWRDGAPLEMAMSDGQRRPIAKGDRIRVRGRLIIENGHPNDGPAGSPIDGVVHNVSGRPFVELHPYDWRGIVEDPLPGPTGVRSHDLLLIAPLYDAVELTTQPNPQFTDQLDRLVTLNTFPAAFRNSISSSNVFAAPPAPDNPATLNWTETVLINATGQSIDELRTITVGTDSISVTARVDAAPHQSFGPFPTADLRSLADGPTRAVLLVRYQLAWIPLARTLTVPPVFVDGPRESIVNVHAFDEATAPIDGAVIIDDVEVARTFQDFSRAFPGHRVRHVEKDAQGHPVVTWTWALDPTNVVVRAAPFPDTAVTVASTSDV